MKQILFLLLFFSISTQAQFQISGVVKDSQTLKPLPFSTVYLNSTTKTISDNDGKFSLTLEQSSYLISVSHVGYESKTIAINKFKNVYLIELNSNSSLLKDVVIENSLVARNIVLKTIDSKNKNDPEKKLKTFQFKTYNKLLITASADSISGQIDTVYTKKRGKMVMKIDSSEYKFKKIITKQHFFQTEKVSQFQYKNPDLKETVLGTKMSGFKKPIYEIFGFNLQSFSIYENQYQLLQTKYISPIATNAIQEYEYKLLDTIEIEKRKTSVIYFKNKKKSKENGLEGILYIDQENFGIAKAVMRSKGIIEISGTHEYQFLENEKIWFPTSTTFKIRKGKNDEDVKIFGGTIQFEADSDKNTTPRKKQASDFVYLQSTSRNFDFEYDLPIQIKKSFTAIEIQDKAIAQPESFWNLYRKDSLDSRSQKTYLSLDSISIKNKIEDRIVLGRKIINGFVPIGFYDLDLRKVFNFNNYEGFRFCLGGKTGERFSKIYQIENYVAYGTKDGNWKYNLGFKTRIGRYSNSWVGASYTNDLQEIASTVFEVEKKNSKLFQTSILNFSSFYNYVNWKVFLETKIIPKTESIWVFSHDVVKPKFEYTFNLNGQKYTTFDMTTALVSLNWSPFSKFMQTPVGRNEVNENYPKFTFQFTKSLPKILKNDFDFTKFDFKTYYLKKYLDGSVTNIIFSLGVAVGDVPITHLYNNSPNSLNKDKLLQRFSIDGNDDFETMYFNEFFSSEYAFLQLKHDFKKFTLSKKSKPNFALVTRLAIGNISKPEQHLDIEYKTLKKGYFESGIELNKIFKGFGLSAFYRYGPNKLPDFEDNLAIRFNFKIDFL